jgi:glutathione peroxidase-family protein
MALRRTLPVLLLLPLLLLSSGCITDEEGDGNGDGKSPREGTTEGFILYDLTFEDHSGASRDLREVEADFLVVHVVSPSSVPFMPQFAQVRRVMEAFDNVTIEAVTLRETRWVGGATMAELREDVDAGWTFGHAKGLRSTLSIVRYPSVFVLDRDQVVLERSDDALGQGRMVEVIEATWGMLPREDAMPVTGDQAPELVWRDIEGVEGSLSELRGSVVILDVWEMECPFCLQLFDELAKVHANYSAQGLEVVSLDLITWETDEQVRGIRDSYGANWTFAVDGDNIQSRYDIWRLPLLLILDADGVVRWSFTGYVHSSVIVEQVEKLI